MRRVKWIGGIILICMFISCGKKKKYEGDSIMNYPDMEILFRDYLNPFKENPHSYKIITLEEGKKDSSFLKASEVNWKEWLAPFLQANVYKEKLDGHYTIEILHDTLYGKMTMLMKALDKSEFTQSLSLSARTQDNKVTSVYIESRDDGFFVDREYKLLFTTKPSLQIQEGKKYLFMSPERTIKTLSIAD